MDIATFYHRILQPGVAYTYEEQGLLAPRWDTIDSQALLLVIAHHESGLTHRHQINGPAVGWWQFEKGGGTKQIFSTALGRRALSDFHIPLDLDSAHLAVEYNDTIAFVYARLLLFSDPFAIPPYDGSKNDLFQYYDHLWRPGKPRENSFYESVDLVKRFFSSKHGHSMSSIQGDIKDLGPRSAADLPQ